ncbi:hypothetical protein P691DRAFT_801927, partial [Macrolepiota fuliginosa MF-IS2]
MSFLPWPVPSPLLIPPSLSVAPAFLETRSKRNHPYQIPFGYHSCLLSLIHISRLQKFTSSITWGPTSQKSKNKD